MNFQKEGALRLLFHFLSPLSVGTANAAETILHKFYKIFYFSLLSDFSG